MPKASRTARLARIAARFAEFAETAPGRVAPRGPSCASQCGDGYSRSREGEVGAERRQAVQAVQSVRRAQPLTGSADMQRVATGAGTAGIYAVHDNEVDGEVVAMFWN